MKKYKILYEDKDLYVLYKPAGLAVQSARASVPDLMSMLANACREKGESNPYLGLVNRLDQPVEGILLIGKNQKAAAELSRQVQDHVHMEKWYQALVEGCPSENEDTLVDYLLKDARTNSSRVVSKETSGAKRSELRYRILQKLNGQTLLEIRLLTGRHHQIRVQLSHAGMPIVGDTKYGRKETTPAKAAQPLCLCACRTTFVHPRTKERMTFEVTPQFPVPSTTPE